MAPNLSFEHLFIVLALTGCSKATPAADTVRSDPNASAATQAAPPPPTTTAATIGASAAPGASAIELQKRKMGPTGQASCGAGSCTSDIKKK